MKQSQLPFAVVEVKNAKVTGTMLGIGDHGLMTCTVHMEQWEQLKGKICRVAYSEAFGLIRAVGNALKDEWAEV